MAKLPESVKAKLKAKRESQRKRAAAQRKEQRNLEAAQRKEQRKLEAAQRKAARAAMSEEEKAAEAAARKAARDEYTAAREKEQNGKIDSQVVLGLLIVAKKDSLYCLRDKRAASRIDRTISALSVHFAAREKAAEAKARRKIERDAEIKEAMGQTPEQIRAAQLEMMASLERQMKAMQATLGLS